MRTFETKIDYLRYQVLLEVAKCAWNENLIEYVFDIPKKIIPGKTATMRCCVYKERAILAERVKLAMGGDRKKKSIIEVIDIACDECPIGGYEVTDNCRGCLAQRCIDVCPKKAISFDNRYQAHIDKVKCINCGKCAEACQYEAIIDRKRPCENACAVKAIEIGEDKVTRINEDKCIDCGVCISQCPFGAINDKSYILDAIDYIIKSDSNTNYNVYALIAPSIVDGFKNTSIKQLVSAIKMLGFKEVYEVASGADLVALNEAKELEDKKFLMTSCCPSFVRFVKNNYPELSEFISNTDSPMTAMAKLLKANDPDCRIVFIGPCTSKKAESKLANVKDIIDVVITYNELQALFDSKDIDETKVVESEFISASSFGRGFARTSGVTNAITQALKEIDSKFVCNPEVCNGLEECKIALLKKKSDRLEANFIEGMACKGGCINGAGVQFKYSVNPKIIDDFASSSNTKTIRESVEKITNNYKDA